MRRMSRATLLIAALIGAAAPALGQAGPGQSGNRTVCPATGRATITPVFRALSLEKMANFRREHGLDRVNPRNLKPLRAYGSADVCQRLDAYYATSMFARAPWQRTYFEADGFYFASFIDTSARNTGRRKVGHFAVFDASLRLVGVFPVAREARRE